MQSGASLNQAAPLEVVDNSDHRRAVKVGGAGKVALLEVGIGLDDDEYAKQARGYLMFSQALGKIAEQRDLRHA
jgi:hypothetical protein